MKKTFQEWMREVDRILIKRTMLSSMDLPDVSYHDWYDSGCTPTQAAGRAIRYAKEEMGF